MSLVLRTHVVERLDVEELVRQAGRERACSEVPIEEQADAPRSIGRLVGGADDVGEALRAVREDLVDVGLVHGEEAAAAAAGAAQEDVDGGGDEAAVLVPALGGEAGHD